MRIKFCIRSTSDLRSEAQKESYERIWKQWKMRTVPPSWRTMTVRDAKAELLSCIIGTANLKIFTSKETHNVR